MASDDFDEMDGIKSFAKRKCQPSSHSSSTISDVTSHELKTKFSCLRRQPLLNQAVKNVLHRLAFS